MKSYSETFPTYGFVNMEFEKDELVPIKEEIDYIRNNEYLSKKFNHALAGHIIKEFSLENCKQYVEELINPVVAEYIKNYGYPNYINNILSDNCQLYLDNLWVNFQKKYEFNPPHMHSGIFSFVIWIQIPYGPEELEVFSDIKSDKRNGCFEFFYTDSFGFPTLHTLFADKSYEGKGLFFPSTIQHCVQPFYTSDEYRISVSGNIKLKV